MLKQQIKFSVVCGLLLLSIASCKHQQFKDVNETSQQVRVDVLSEEMQQVRDYIPKWSVISHRGSTYWTPEETEASYCWAREMGGDYLEADLQVTRDGVVLALHDDKLNRTTNIDQVYFQMVPSTRKQYYMTLGYTPQKADSLFQEDVKNFIPSYAGSYTYSELLELDAGTWFNNANPNQARSGFTPTGGKPLYISALEDLIHYSRGDRLKRDPATKERIWTIIGILPNAAGGDSMIKSAIDGQSRPVVKYEFGYEADPNTNGNKPGIYIEVKEPWLATSSFIDILYGVLDKNDMNIITKPENPNTPFYVNGNVNVNNTNGKVILQTFSLQALGQICKKFQGKVPNCFLLWLGNGATDLKYNTPEAYASFINFGIQNKAHYIGPSIAGVPNNYDDLDLPWQADLVHRAKMDIHAYSFDSYQQMAQKMGDFEYGNTGPGIFNPPYTDAMFTNRTEITLQYFLNRVSNTKNSTNPFVFRDGQAIISGKAPRGEVADPQAVLTYLGF